MTAEQFSDISRHLDGIDEMLRNLGTVVMSVREVIDVIGVDLAVMHAKVSAAVATDAHDPRFIGANRRIALSSNGIETVKTQLRAMADSIKRSRDVGSTMREAVEAYEVSTGMKASEP